MLKIQKLSLAALMVSAVVSGSVFAEDKAAPSASDASYAVGALMGNQVKDLVDVRKDEKIQQTLDGIQEQLVSAAKAKVEQQAKAAKEEGDKYRAEFAKKDGVKSTKDGLLYKITEAGKGDAIKATDTVKVHYTGKLPDGKVFDSSVERGQPVEFKLNQVIKGWTEGLQLVKKGGKIELVIPPELAYGKQGAGDSIPPDATLYFEVEVLDVNPKK